MHFLSFKVIDTRNVWHLGYVQLPNRRDEKVRLEDVVWIELAVFAAFDADIDFPFIRCFVPASSRDGGVESDVLEEGVFLRDADEVLLLLLATVRERVKGDSGGSTRISSWPGYNRDQSGFCSNE